MTVFADPDAIHQVVYNLCDNAVKFSKPGGQLSLNIHEKDKKVFFSVKNTGIGIPPEDLPFVFDRFFKSDKSRGLDKTGVGLGLYIVKTILDSHGEEIWVKSEYGEYCEFVFTLSRVHESKAQNIN
ncbi:Sensor protein SrrB [bioreactor metagenome]|uniref:histidine kinase n=1 Tax=bioreactor metagenome TaxID=1076179 RepID=A0A645BAM9_9ZZZZ